MRSFFLTVLFPFLLLGAFDHGKVYMFRVDSIAFEKVIEKQNGFYSVTIGDSVYVLDGAMAKFTFYVSDTFSKNKGKFEFSTSTNSPDDYSYFSLLFTVSSPVILFPQFVKSNGSRKYFSGRIGATFITGTSYLGDTLAFFYQDSSGNLTDTMFLPGDPCRANYFVKLHNYTPLQTGSSSVGNHFLSLRHCRGNTRINLLGRKVLNFKKYNGVLLIK